MRLFTLNEKDNPDLSPEQVRQDFRRARKLMGNGVVIGGLQEIGEQADHHALRTAFTPWGEVNHQQATPQIFNPRWVNLVATRYIMAHGGLKGRSPHRGFQVSRFKLKYRPWLNPFIVINTHMVSHPERDEWSRVRWLQHWNMMKDTVNKAHENGLDVFLMGDLNRIEIPAIHHSERILNERGLDHILLVRATQGNKYTVTDKGYYRKDFHTDHPLLWVDIKVGKR
jgi:hypothetical protein